jgi:lipopolysaccharide/colanic/teichoic acid biosynthesis glycosyltransferase
VVEAPQEDAVNAPALSDAQFAEPDDLEAADARRTAIGRAGVAMLAQRRAHALSGPRGVRPGLKRGLDVIVAGSVLVAALPLMAIIALAIVLDSPGPVFYRAERLGRGGRPLSMLKFRKMHRSARGPGLTTGNDRRLTRIGVVLARTKLDELPQLVNVLRGDMSMIGPRPEDPRFVGERPEDFEEILNVRPGITGLAQIAFANESRILSEDDPIGHYIRRILPQKCILDRVYVRTVGLRTDLRILAWTVVAVLLRREVAVDRATGSMSLRGGRAASDAEQPCVGRRGRHPRAPARARGHAAHRPLWPPRPDRLTTLAGGDASSRAHPQQRQ